MSMVDNNGFDENNVKAAGQFPMSLSDLKPEELSPMMQHYAEMKAKCEDSFLLYRLGDFYEMFFDDAVKAPRPRPPDGQILRHARCACCSEGS